LGIGRWQWRFSVVSRIGTAGYVITGQTALTWSVMSDVTKILEQIERGESNSTEELLLVVYDELRQLATAKLANELPGQTIQATALVHDAFVRLVDQKSPQQWDNRGHFFSAAAEAMRRILIERARQRASLKKGGDRERIEMAAIDPAILPLACDDILALDEALEQLKEQHPRKAELVKLRFYAGLTTAQAAQGMGISTTTAENDWVYARSWLRVKLFGKGKV